MIKGSNQTSFTRVNGMWAGVSRGLVSLSLTVFALLGPTALADDTAKPSAEDGRIMAESLCASCHAVGPAGDSPVTDAPPFRIFATMWPLEHLEEALAEGIMVGHPSSEMPVFQFTPTEIAHLIAYMETVQTDSPAQ